MPCGLRLSTGVVSIAVDVLCGGLLECALWTTTQYLSTGVVSIAVDVLCGGLLECALWTTTQDRCSQYSC